MRKDLSIKRIVCDADTWKYKACWAANAKQEEDVPFSRAVLCLNNFLRGQFKYLEGTLGKKINIREWIESDKLATYLTSADNSNFRFSVATIQGYKANRKDAKKPPHLDGIFDWLQRKWRSEVVYNMEADDKLGIEAAKDPDHTLIWHEDKDIWQCYGWHGWYDGNRATTRRLEFVEYPGRVTMERSASGALELFTTGEYRLYYQMLVGDSSDNIPKVVKEVKSGREYGYGDMEIYEMFNGRPIEEIEQLVLDIYNKHYGSDAEARFNEIYSLVKILDEEPEYTLKDLMK